MPATATTTTTHVLLEDERIPLTPLDECWAIDGCAYVRFAEMEGAPVRAVGRLADPTLAGHCRLQILAARPHSVPVEVVHQTDTAPPALAIRG